MTSRLTGILSAKHKSKWKPQLLGICPEMRPVSPALVLAGILFCFYAGEATKAITTDNQCISMNGGPFESCSVAGYNQTFPLPKKITNTQKKGISLVLRWMLKAVENCSENNVADVMTCSMFAPKCVTGSPNPVLPCRRVCGEFLKQCETTLRRFHLDYMVGLCLILPNKTASSGTCFEPQNFRTNDSVRGKSCLQLGINFTELNNDSLSLVYFSFGVVLNSGSYGC